MASGKPAARLNTPGMSARSRLLGMFFYLLVVLAAWLFNRGYAWMGSAFVLACLGLPWLGGQAGACWQTIYFRRRGWGLGLLLSLGYLLAFGAVCGWLRRLGVAGLQMGRVFTWPQIVAQLILALAEEFFFRGYLQEQVGASLWSRRAWGPLTCKNLAAALLFGLAHTINRPSPAAVLTALGGLFLGWLVEQSEGSIWPAVMLHAVSNTAMTWLLIIV